MPAAAGLGIGAALGGIGGALNQQAANKGPQALYPGLQGQGTADLSSIAAPSFTSLMSLIKTGNPVSTQGVDQAATATHNLQQSQSLAKLRESFGASGMSNSSPAAVGIGNFLAQDDASFQSMLAQLNYQSATDAANRQQAATNFGISSFLPPAFTDVGPKGSVGGAFLGGAGAGASGGAATASSISSSLSMLALLKQLGLGGGTSPIMS
jgi:hypothetical protein